jgi:hypothetical protein
MNPGETDQILIGSYILFDCKSGYTNTDNNLNVVCNANGQWSTFPGCIALTTTIAPDTLPTTTQSNLGNNGLPMTMNSGSKRKKRWIWKLE